MNETRPFSWMHPHLEIQDTDRCGRGVFAKTDIAVGERLCVMGGYIVPVAEEIDDYGLQIDENFVLSSGGGGMTATILIIAAHRTPGSRAKSPW